jgi:hypothetical protein
MTIETTDAVTLLKKDHRVVAELLKEIEATTERAEKTRDELFAKIKKMLDVHSEIEETILYPALKETEETHDITLEAYEEHAVVKTLLAELAAEDKTTEAWLAKLTVMRENIEHHVEEEEKEMFKEMEQALPKELLEDIGQRMAEKKQELIQEK